MEHNVKCHQNKNAVLFLKQSRIRVVPAKTNCRNWLVIFLPESEFFFFFIYSEIVRKEHTSLGFLRTLTERIDLVLTSLNPAPKQINMMTQATTREIYSVIKIQTCNLDRIIFVFVSANGPESWWRKNFQNFSSWWAKVCQVFRDYYIS